MLELDEALATSPSERQLLWIDVTGPMPEGLVARLTEVFSLDDTTAEALDAAGTEPVLTVHGSYLHVRVAAEPDAEHPRDTPWLAVVAAPNAVITLHERPITFLDDLDDQVQADAAYGLLDSQSFLATLLHVTVTSYHGAIDRIEDDIERLDDRSLRDRGGRRMLNELVEVRSRIAGLRRLLAKHRYVYGALSGVVLGEPDAEPSPGNLALSDVAKAYRRRDDRRRGCPRARARVVQRLRDAHRPADERHDEGPDARHRAAPARVDDRRVAGHERASCRSTRTARCRSGSWSRVWRPSPPSSSSSPGGAAGSEPAVATGAATGLGCGAGAAAVCGTPARGDRTGGPRPSTPSSARSDSYVHTHGPPSAQPGQQNASSPRYRGQPMSWISQDAQVSWRGVMKADIE